MTIDRSADLRPAPQTNVVRGGVLNGQMRRAPVRGEHRDRARRAAPRRQVAERGRPRTVGDPGADSTDLHRRGRPGGAAADDDRGERRLLRCRIGVGLGRYVSRSRFCRRRAPSRPHGHRNNRGGGRRDEEAGECASDNRAETHAAPSCPRVLAGVDAVMCHEPRHTDLSEAKSNRSATVRRCAIVEFRRKSTRSARRSHARLRHSCRRQPIVLQICIASLLSRRRSAASACGVRPVPRPGGGTFLSARGVSPQNCRFAHRPVWRSVTPCR
jgi:hypothetical protein